MNILFYTSCEVSPETGGTERITASISQGLSRLYGVRCYSLYSSKVSEDTNLTPFEGKCCVPHVSRNRSKVEAFIRENHIDLIINQGCFSLTHIFRNALPEQSKVVFVHHFNPGSEHVAFSSVFRKFIGNLSKAGLMNFTRYLVYKMLHPAGLPGKYRDTYRYADRIVLLSLRFKDEFLKYACLKDDHFNKITAIHNSLSFPDFFDMNRYENKKKQVLIVSRLEETQKKIGYALKIWESIESETDLEDWELVIVGKGQDEASYHDYVRSHGLKRVRFEGRQNPKRYYEEASIFMLTSSFEGWGLTLTEAQQFGCVPLAFYSYASLPDIITDGKNGFMIPYPALEVYQMKMMELMRDDEKRKAMAGNAVQSAHRFENDAICRQWMQLLEETCNRK